MICAEMLPPTLMRAPACFLGLHTAWQEPVQQWACRVGPREPEQFGAALPTTLPTEYQEWEMLEWLDYG